MNANDGIRCMIMRGGTSKGLYFVKDDLPTDPTERDAALISMMGSGDPRQIDGLGGATSLTSKVAVVSAAADGDGVDYLFLQLGVDEAVVSDRQNCGNILAGVGPFAIERGLVQATGDHARIPINMINTGSRAIATFALENGTPRYEGDTYISGVPFPAAPIQLEFEGIAGSSAGALLPTGNPVDVIDGVEVTLIDNGMPVVIMRAADLGTRGDESPAELEENQELKDRIESIRRQAGPLMNLGDVTATTIPKMFLVSAPQAGGAINTRSFIPHRVHEAVGVLAAVSVATAALIPGTPAYAVATLAEGQSRIAVEHPTGTFDAVVYATVPGATAPIDVRGAGIIRTTRKLMDGTAFAATRNRLLIDNPALNLP